MFLNYIKLFFVKNKIKRNIQDYWSGDSDVTIKKVGLLIDESCFFKKDVLINELIENGFSRENLKIIVYRDQIKKNDTYLENTFSSRSLNWSGTFSDSKIIDFVNQSFDLLISYYEVEKPFLVLITNDSKAKFKVGFSEIDNRLNHFVIKTKTENYSVFVHELFRYLKILNKI